MQQGRTCGQLFLKYFKYLHFRGLTFKKLAYIAFEKFFERSEVYRQLHIYNTKEIKLAPHLRQVFDNQEGLHTNQIKPNSQWQNSADQGVGILKRGGARLMRNTGTPSVLWEWDLDYESEVKSFTVRLIPQLQGRTPHENITG